MLKDKKDKKDEKNKNPQKKERGQISIMIAVMMSTFILFFAFVINTGMLVNAKINLQNAADLAAYAGAAVQARQLTQISYLNYEMRRQWKKFLFRVYVVGNMSQDSFPRNGGADAPMSYRPNNNSGTDYGIPTTCIIFNTSDNYCHLTSLPRIAMPPHNPLDAITDTLTGQLEQLEQIRQMNCKSIGMTNLMVNMYWLYNADPSLSSIGSLGMQQQQQNTIRIVQGLAYGLGIVPRETLLKFRVDTLASYVNAPSQQALTKSKVEGFQSMPDTAPYERAMQAFYSAYYTLGNHAFPGESVVMDEMLPGTTDAAQLLMLKPITQKFDTFAIDFDMGNGVGGNTAAGQSTGTNYGADCTAVRVPISVTQPLTVGVYKDPSVLTYYAVRLKAKARVLYSPFGDIEMKAYAAARPFGSRIGPNDTQTSFGATSGTPTLGGSSEAGSQPELAGFIPNLPLAKTDSAARGKGWDNQATISQMYQFLVSGSGGTANGVTANNMETAYQSAMAPNPWEATRYNIINDQGADPFMRNFGSDMLAAFWAPVFPQAKMANFSGEIQTAMNLYFTGNAQGNFGSGTNQGQNLAKLKDAVTKSLQQYITQLQQGTGENGEGINIVKIMNPFVTKNGGQFSPISGNPQYIMTDPREFKTSWNSVNHSMYQSQGRVGYSVKFVSFDSLTKNKTPSNGTATWTNSFPVDPEAESDIPFLKH